jgi:uracil-DNA glycosylase
VSSTDELRAEAAGCTRCDLHRDATQTVFGEGPACPSLVLVGEQPLGATAAQAGLGPKARVTRDRGTVIPAHDDVAVDVLVTVHPSAMLRMSSPERDAAFGALVRDLEIAAQHGAS